MRSMLDELQTMKPHIQRWVDEAIARAMKSARAFNMTVDVYTTSQSVVVVPNCFAFMFTNIGDTTATVNGMVVFPSATPTTALGDSRSVSGHLLDLYKGNLIVSMAQPLGAAPAVEIVQLFYHPAEIHLSNR